MIVRRNPSQVVCTADHEMLQMYMLSGELWRRAWALSHKNTPPVWCTTICMEAHHSWLIKLIRTSDYDRGSKDGSFCCKAWSVCCPWQYGTVLHHIVLHNYILLLYCQLTTYINVHRWESLAQSVCIMVLCLHCHVLGHMTSCVLQLLARIGSLLKVCNRPCELISHF